MSVIKEHIANWASLERLTIVSPKLTDAREGGQACGISIYAPAECLILYNHPASHLFSCTVMFDDG